MSKQEQHMSLIKPEVRQRPEVLSRPSVQSIFLSPADGEHSDSSEGKAKGALNKTSGYSELPTGTKKPPAVRPKPASLNSQLQMKAEQAPPLPKKRSCVASKPRVEGVEPKGTSAEGGRSAPDGREVDAQVSGGSETESEHGQDAPAAFCSDQSCSCLCHLQQPGMMLIWVPVEVETVEKTSNCLTKRTPKDVKNRKKDEEADQGGKEDGRAKEEGDCSVKEKQATKQNKSVFQERLEGLLAAHHRASEAGPHTTSNHCPPSPVPLKPTPSPPPIHEPLSQDEEESIYETNLPYAEHYFKKTLLVNDMLKFSESNNRKLACESEPRGGASKPIIVETSLNLGDAPPARLPKAPKMLGTPPPSRPPPLPPVPSKKDVRRHSNVSSNSGEENGRSEDGDDIDTRTFSFKLETHLQNEPLYQMYRKTVITKEIRRQTVNRNISKTSYDYPVDWMSNRNRKGSDASGFNEEANSSTLWQELPEVRDSGMLEQLSTKELKYQESMFEVLTSEASYLRSLRILTEHFLDNRELNDTLVIRDKKTLFSNILRVREVSERFLKDLEDHIFKDIVFPDICGIIHYHAQHNFPAYIDYVRNQIYQEKTFSELKKNNTKFAAVIRHLQESPQCQRLPFVSFLLLPFQRITRIKMLIENILKRTKQGTKEEQEAIKALDSVSKIIDKCNTEVGKMRQVEELVHLSRMLEFDSKVKAIPIISETRFLEKKGELLEMSRGKTIVNMRMKFNPVNLFLFNDLLIIAVKKSGERFLVTDYAHRSLVQVQPLEDDSSIAFENCFNFIILENSQGRMIERLIKAPSKSDMHRWLAAFPDPSVQDDEERIYEDFDCPQVQCVEQYVAEQADELSLEPAEIVNVIRKTNEGWYEGCRLSDGQRGWFPIANVIEITNEHVRRRNLLERYRVSQAASMLSKTR